MMTLTRSCISAFIAIGMLLSAVPAFSATAETGSELENILIPTLEPEAKNLRPAITCASMIGLKLRNCLFDKERMERKQGKPVIKQKNSKADEEVFRKVKQQTVQEKNALEQRREANAKKMLKLRDKKKEQIFERGDVSKPIVRAVRDQLKVNRENRFQNQLRMQRGESDTTQETDKAIEVAE